MQWKSHQQDGHRTKTTRNAEKPQNFDADAAGAAAALFDCVKMGMGFWIYSIQ